MSFPSSELTDRGTRCLHIAHIASILTPLARCVHVATLAARDLALAGLVLTLKGRREIGYNLVIGDPHNIHIFECEFSCSVVTDSL